jgi:transcriptional regulator with XRE-family HTH domain
LYATIGASLKASSVPIFLCQYFLAQTLWHKKIRSYLVPNQNLLNTMAQTHFIARFRERTGMTQEALAALLRVNRSQLNMNERSERMLPTETTLRLVQFTQMMSDPAFAAKAAPPVASPVQREKLQQKLLQHASRLRYKAAQLEKKIKTHEKAEAQRGQMRVLLAAMKSAHALQTPTAHEAKWLAFQESLGGFYYNYNDWEVEAYQLNLLTHRMLLLEAEEAERMAAELE